MIKNEGLDQLVLGNFRGATSGEMKGYRQGAQHDQEMYIYLNDLPLAVKWPMTVTRADGDG
jgi:hypothetical protein